MVTTTYLYQFPGHGKWPLTGDFKNNKKFKTFTSKNARGCLREVVVYKRFQIKRFDLETFGILEKRLLWRRAQPEVRLLMNKLSRPLFACLSILIFQLALRKNYSQVLMRKFNNF